MTYLAGLRAAEAACLRQQELYSEELREAKGTGNRELVSEAGAHAHGVRMCLARIQTLIELAPRRGNGDAP